MDYRLLNHSSLPDLLIPRTHTFSTDSGFTHPYLLHSFQGLKQSGRTDPLVGQTDLIPPSAKDLFYPFLVTPTAPHSKKQQNHTNIECSVYLNRKLNFYNVLWVDKLTKKY
jgi:hypothetical protein